MSTSPRIAIVHDYLNQLGGAERVVAALHTIFPWAPIFTSIVDRQRLWPELRDADIRTSWMQRLPGLRKHFKKYLLLYPLVFERLDLRGFDVVISSSSAFARGTRRPPGGRHICYCHTPPRFLWDYPRYVEREEFGRATRTVLPAMVALLRVWDRRTAGRPDQYVANSTVVRDRIRRIYRREAIVVPPPVEVTRFRTASPEGYYLIVSRLNPYKRIDLAVEAFDRLGLPLVVIGDGPARRSLEAMAGPTIRFLGHLPDSEVARYYAGCEAFVFPGEEDFGITVLEANASGRPVVAYRAGGVLDTVRDGVTGVLFDTPSAESLAEAVRRHRASRWESGVIRRHAESYGSDAFRERLMAVVDGEGAPVPTLGRVVEGTC